MNFPSSDDVLKYITESDIPLTKRDLVKAFDITGDERKPFKQLLRTLEQSGKIFKGDKQAYSIAGSNHLPAIGMVEITEIDIDGDLIATPSDWDSVEQGDAPRIEITSNTPMKVGDKGLAKLTRFSDSLYEGRIIRGVDKQHHQIIGQIAKTAKGFILKPIDKKAKHDLDIAQANLGDAQAGDLVTAEVLASRGLKRRSAKVIERLGHKDDVHAISLIALHEAGLHEKFLDKVNDAAQGLNGEILMMQFLPKPSLKPKAVAFI